jgi:hypothetical protein
LPVEREEARLAGLTAAERKKLLEKKESAELQQHADRLAEEIRELSGEAASRIL